MNQKGFVNIAVIIGVIVLIGVAGYFIANRQTPLPEPTPSPAPSPNPTPSPTPSPNPTPSPTPAPEKNKSVSVLLGQQFTLGKGQIAKVSNTGLEIEITAFFNNPCQGVCVWSGVGIGFEYRFNGEVQKGINLVQAFGYQTTIVKTDHETYANLIVEKMQ